MPFVNKFKILVCTACLMLVGQGFAMDSWIDHKSSTTPTKTDGCYQIYTPAELAWFAHKVNSIRDATSGDYCAKVMADLDMAGYHWIPISAKGTQRAVNFDGNNKIISNLYISAEEILKKYPNDRQYAQNLGLIGAFTGHVQNVILENVEVYAYGNGYVSGNSNYEKSPLSIGTVVGWQANPNSIVENCYVTGKMVTSGDGQAVGGIVGNNGGGTIRNCYSEVNIDASGTAYVGGIAGYTKAYTSGAVATISSCVYAGNTLSSTGAGAAGAIVGNHYDGTTAFENVYYDSDIFGNNSIGRTREGDTTGSPTGASELNSALIACTLNGGEMVDGVCTKDSPWSDAATGISLNGYGADGYKITFNANGGSFAGGTTFVKYVKAGNIINNDGVANPSWGDDSYVFAGWSGDDYNKAATKATTITASWNKMHTITFSPVNGDLQGTFPNGSSESVSIKIEDGKRIVVQGFARPTTFTNASGKYNFVGWAFAESPTTALVADGLDNLPLATRDTTLLAVWTTAAVYTVRFFENDASTASYVSTVYENDKATELTVDKMDPHPGYTFEGWFESGAEKSFDFEQVITSDVELFAKWTKKSYTVNYVLNCSDECTNSNADEFTVDGMALSNPTWDEAHRFLGWYADAEFKDKKTSIPSGLTDDITLYAEWETITYDITYRAGAYGTGLVAAEKKIHNEAYTLRDASYTRKGYLQSGWVSEEGLTYAFGDEYSANASLIIYPTWSDPIVYSITYVCDGCVNDPSNPDNYTVETSTFSVKFKNLTPPDGYKMVGWYSAMDYKTKVEQIKKGSFGDTTLYAKLNKIYKITYVGTDKPRCDTLYTVDDAITLRNPADSAGYTFGGWFTNANFEGDAATGIVKGSTGDTTFYAKWVPVPYTITYNIDGEPAELTPNTYTAASATELATPTRDGYEFDGWYTNAEFNGDKVTSIAAGTTGDTTFFAKWTANTYTVTYDAGNFGNGTVAAGTKTHDVDFELSSDKFTRTGYTQEGWENAKGDIVSSPYTENADITLYPHWVLATYTITYDLDDGTNNANNPASYTIEAADITLEDPSKEGFEFVGWYEEKSFDTPVSVIYTSAATPVTVYAKWEKAYPFLVGDYGAVKVYENSDGSKTAKINTNSSETVNIPSDIKVKYVEFVRKFTAGKNSTIMLPFSIDTTKISGGSFKEFAYVDEKVPKAVFYNDVAGGIIRANTPYIFVPSSDTLIFNLGEKDTVTLNTSNIVVPASNTDGGKWQFRGVYSHIDWPSGDRQVWGFVANTSSEVAKIGKFMRAGAGAYIDPLRGYLYNTEAETPAQPGAPRPFLGKLDYASANGSMDVEFVERDSDETTFISKANSSTGNVKVINSWYDMSGRKLNVKPTTKGIYYYNGKQVLVR